MAANTICSDFGAPKNKFWHCFHCFPIYFPWSDGTDAMIFVFWMLSFKPNFLLSFTFIKKLFSSSLLSAIRVGHLHIWGYWHFSRKSWFQLVLLPAQSLSWCTLYKLSKQGDNIQPCCTPFPIWNQSVVPCPVLTVDSWPTYRFLKRQVRWSGIPISFRIFHSLLWSTQSKALA